VIDVATAERVQELVAPLFAGTSVELVDVVFTGGTLRITVDRPGGVDLDEISRLTRRVSAELDDHDAVPGRYTLEVSSPGLERPLRTPEHFRRAVGGQVSVKTRPGIEGDRRVAGALVDAGEATITVRPDDGSPERILRYEHIERARTIFEWGPADRPDRPTPKRQKRRKKEASA
jgi:ribosome maturation factor RimP